MNYFEKKISHCCRYCDCCNILYIYFFCIYNNFRVNVNYHYSLMSPTLTHRKRNSLDRLSSSRYMTIIVTSMDVIRWLESTSPTHYPTTPCYYFTTPPLLPLTCRNSNSSAGVTSSRYMTIIVTSMDVIRWLESTSPTHYPTTPPLLLHHPTTTTPNL